MAWIAAAIAGAAALAGSIKSGSDSAGMSKYQLDYQRDLANSAHTRQVFDLKRAGLNPILSARMSGSGNVSPVGTNIPDYGKSASTAIKGAQAYADVQQKEASVENLGANTAYQKAQKILAQEQSIKTQAEVKNIQANTESIRTGIGLTEHKQELTRAQTILTQHGASQAEVNAFIAKNETELLDAMSKSGDAGSATADIIRLFRIFIGKR